MTEQTRRIAYAASGLAIGGLIVFAALNTSAPEDDRPPIIVRGGSLYFDNGVPNDRPGKAWKRVEGAEEYYIDQQHGKPVRLFQVYFVGGTIGGQGEPCRPVTVTDLSVRFDHDNDVNTAPATYFINIRERGQREARVSGPDLKPSDDSTRLTAAAAGAKTIYSVGVSQFECMSPKEVWIEAVKP